MVRKWSEVRADAKQDGRIDEARIAAHKERLITQGNDFAANQQEAAGRLPPVHPGEILQEEFLEPHELTTADLAEHLHMPAESVESLARTERPTTADDALRLARYFNTTPEFWLNLQTQHDLELTRERIRHELTAITPHLGNSDT